jgi:hypothetical protein
MSLRVGGMHCSAMPAEPQHDEGTDQQAQKAEPTPRRRFRKSRAKGKVRIAASRCAHPQRCDFHSTNEGRLGNAGPATVSMKGRQGDTNAVATPAKPEARCRFPTATAAIQHVRKRSGDASGASGKRTGERRKLTVCRQTERADAQEHAR